MPSIAVKVWLSDKQAAKLQDFGAMLRVSAEDVISAAVKVGLTDWPAVEGELIVHPPGGMSDEERQLPLGWRRFRATLDLDRDRADRVDEAADWFDRDLAEFLAQCLQSGIAHAQSEMLEADRQSMAEGAAKLRLVKSDGGRPLTETIDDDIPF